MNKEEFKKKLMEQQIFDELKDCCISNNYIRLKYQGLDIDHNKVYRRIVNYRIKKYGTSFLISPAQGVIKTTREYRKINANSNVRKYAKRTSSQKYETKKFIERNSKGK